MSAPGVPRVPMDSVTDARTATVSYFLGRLENRVDPSCAWPPGRGRGRFAARKTRSELRFEIIRWIERTYNHRRRQRSLGKLTPVEFELAFAGRVDLAA